MDIAEISRDIRARRRAMEVTQESLAFAAGVAVPTLIGIEKGDTKNPGIETVNRIISALETLEVERKK